MHARATYFATLRCGAVGTGLVGAALLLTGCAGQSAGGGDFGQVTVGPGDSKTCYSTPCTIYYQMPAGQGTYTVRVNGQVGANVAAGTVGNLGGFYRYDSPIRITVDGMAVKDAVVFIVATM
ncbi:MAG: hypothetical protein MUE39_03285 [Gammaproteobacteria bacterium]|jgi:hypothetical protein|nr:hypothetical protein [Gammaproteobacteria bacterium]